MMTYETKITFGEMRASGVRDVLIYCRDHRCSHHVEINADRWPDHIRPSDIALSFTCTACGKRGTDKSPGQKAGLLHFNPPAVAARERPG